jgi:serine/threonine protein kinase
MKQKRKASVNGRGQMSPALNRTWVDLWERVGGQSIRGGQARVLKVRNKKTGTVGALKEILPNSEASERRSRMAREVIALKVLNGFGVPRVLDDNTDLWRNPESELYIVMEWIDGCTLEQLISGRPMPAEDAISLVYRLAEILEKCHNTGIHHRDIKPDNIILRDRKIEDAIIVDFGLAWLSDPDKRAGFETSAGEDLTSRFLALPEGIPNMHTTSQVSDVTLLVGVLFYSTTGLAPRQLENSERKLPHEALSERIPDKVKQDPLWHKLTRIFRIGFQQSIRERYQSMAELRSSLQFLNEKVEPSDIEAKIRAETERLQERLLSSDVSERTKVLELMQEASQVFLKQIELPAELSGGSHGLNVSGGGTRVDSGGSFLRKVSNAGQDVQVLFYHRTTTDGIKIIASYSVETSDLESYYEGRIADRDSLLEAAKKAGKTCRYDILQAFNDKLG